MTGGGARFSDLRVRLISSVIVGGVGFFCIWIGGLWTALLAGLATAAMMIEWRSITLHRGGPCGFDVTALVVAVIAAIAVAAVHDWPVALAVLGGLIGIAAALDVAARRSGAAWWGVLGAAYIGTAGVAFVSLRNYDPFGFLMILWVALTVVAADIGGYFAGRLIGGPKLWPAVSPKKTWAGLGGAVVLAMLVGWAFSGATTGTYYYEVCTVSALAALLAQAGDMGESALKRHFGVKDSGTLLPGHGGALDRLDGHMAATLVAAAVTFSRDQAVFIW